MGCAVDHLKRESAGSQSSPFVCTAFDAGLVEHWQLQWCHGNAPWSKVSTYDLSPKCICIMYVSDPQLDNADRAPLHCSRVQSTS